MFCPSCGVATQPGQRFCNTCGAALTLGPSSAAPDLPPPTIEQPATTAVPPVAPVAAAAAISIPSGEIPPVDSPEFDALFDTARFRVVPQTTDTAEQISTAWEAGAVPWADATDPVPRVGGDTAEAPMLPVAGPAPLRAVMLMVAIATAAVAVTGALLTMVRYRVTGDVTADVSLKANDLSTNALIGAIIAAVMLVIGGALAMSGRRVGHGLAGGAGLGLAGFLAWLAGDAVSVLDSVRQGLAESGMAYRLSTTMDVGLWLLVAAAGLGGVVFIVGLFGSGPDGSPGVHPAAGALGMLGTLAVVIGPMLPLNGATFADNFSSDIGIGPARWWKGFVLLTLGVDHGQVPPVTTWMRLLALLLLLVGGLLGFVAGSRWGLALVGGSFAVAAWQWFSAVAGAGDRPFGIAGGNPGDEDFAPHIVTTVGVAMVAIAVVLGVTTSYLARKDAAATS
jgi:hypothetical protein